MICDVCFHHCGLSEGKTGLCRGRKSDGKKIYPLNYGMITSYALDPIEKKPLKKFESGKMVLSVGSFGCNLSCPFCQNHSISMADDVTSDYFFLSPHELAEKAKEMKEIGNIGVAYTYNEPIIGYEYVFDTSKIIHKMGMKNVVVTNGCFSPWVVEKILPYIDAFNIDLKSFSPDFYKKINGNLEMVKEFIRIASKGAHIEISTLIIPGQNDSKEEMNALSKWIAEINSDIPLHISRFFPRYKMEAARATETNVILDLVGIAKENLKYVFPGNC